MFHNHSTLPFADLLVAIALLVFSVLTNRKIFFVGSLAALLVAIATALLVTGGFDIEGIALMLFGIFCVALSWVRRAATFVSTRSLRLTGVLFVIIGVLSSFLT